MTSANMTSETDLAIVRRAFARQVAFAAACDDPRLEDAFAQVPREAFLGPGPWGMHVYGADRETPDGDPVFLYQDTAIPILKEKRLNNGQPSFLAQLIGFCAIREGEAVVHIGTGSGYYTALMSRLVGAGGHLLGIEHEPELARRAAAAFAPLAQVRIVEGDGFTMPLGAVDAILVNAGTPRFAATWLDALKPGGRLVVPLTYPAKDGDRATTKGIVFKIVRDADGYAARGTLMTVIYPCLGAADPAAESALRAAIETGRAREVTRLRREPVAADRTWLAGDGWSLTYD